MQETNVIDANVNANINKSWFVTDCKLNEYYNQDQKYNQKNLGNNSSDNSANNEEIAYKINEIFGINLSGYNYGYDTSIKLVIGYTTKHFANTNAATKS